MTYEEFVNARLGALARQAVMLTGDTHSAQDLVQETMVRVQLQWRKIAKADLPERYVRRMMINIFLDSRRTSWFKRVLLRADSDETIRIPGDHAQRSVDRDMIWAALAKLPRQQRAALVLRYYEDLSDVDIAETLGCSVGAARGYISKALATLRSKELVTA